MGEMGQCTIINPVLKKCNKGGNRLEDWINGLPDDILISILSRLTIREAASTSVLCRRWENLWKFSTGSLVFDSSKVAYEIAVDSKLYKSKRSDYVSWVNQVCESHKGPTIDEFRICFQLDKTSRRHISKWLKFAIAKHTRVLDLDFTFFVGRDTSYNLYTFPHKFFHRLQSPLGLSRIRYLKSLCFSNVNVSGEHIEFFLSNCPVLEEVCVESSDHLVDLKVTGSSLRLKHLKIELCHSINLVEISASNLESLIYMTQTVRLHIKYAPRLVNVSICGGHSATMLVEPIAAALPPISSYLFQLEALTLQLSSRENFQLPRLPVLYNLRNLTWDISACADLSLLGLTSLIEESCPFLEKFTMKFLIFGVGEPREVQKATRCPHQCLKVVEFVGFCGCPIDYEIAIYLLENAANLEKIKIDTTEPLLLRGLPSSVFKGYEEELEARRARALTLKTELPPGAQLVVL